MGSHGKTERCTAAGMPSVLAWGGEQSVTHLIAPISPAQRCASLVARALGATVIAVFAAALAGCSGSASMLLADSLNANDQPLARANYAGWIAVGAKRCGFNRTPEMIQSAYIAFETKQGATPQQVAKFSEAFDSGMKSAAREAESEPRYCNNRKLAEIKLAFQRQDADDFAPNFPPPDPCGPTGCARASRKDEAFDPGKFWAEKNQEPREGR
jgi:hypothetical protein